MRQKQLKPTFVLILFLLARLSELVFAENENVFCEETVRGGSRNLCCWSELCSVVKYLGQTVCTGNLCSLRKPTQTRCQTPKRFGLCGCYGRLCSLCCRLEMRKKLFVGFSVRTLEKVEVVSQQGNSFHNTVVERDTKGVVKSVSSNYKTLVVDFEGVGLCRIRREVACQKLLSWLVSFEWC